MASPNTSEGGLLPSVEVRTATGSASRAPVPHAPFRPAASSPCTSERAPTNSDNDRPPGDFGPALRAIGYTPPAPATPKGDAPTDTRSDFLKSALRRAKAKTSNDTSPGRCPLPLTSHAKAKLVSRKALESAAASPSDPDRFPSPLTSTAQPRLHGYDMGDTEQACLGILTGLKKEGLITPASPAQPEAPPQSPSRRVSFSEAPATTPRRGARHDDGVKQMDEALDADAAKIAGVWQSDGSQHTSEPQVKAGDPYVPNVRVSPREGRRTLKVLYLFSGVERRASIADHLKRLCCADGTGLDFYDVDIHVGGSSHDLLDGDVQEDYIARILAGEFDFVILSPPCGSWSRANWANNDGPPPCRDRFQPWGFAENTKAQRGRADRGNQFVHFSIRAIQSAQLAKAKGFQVRCLLEHPEDLGRVGRQALHQGVPASIWQLDELRQAFGSNAATTVAGWQCKFPEVDRQANSPLLRHARHRGVLAQGLAHP